LTRSFYLINYPTQKVEEPTEFWMGGLWPHNALPLLFGQDIFPTSAYKNGKADTGYLTHPKVVKAIQFHNE